MSDKSLVPSFILHFNGRRIPVEQEADIKEILVVDRLNAPSLFHIHVSDPEGTWSESSDYGEGAEVKIQLGYKDAVARVITGEVTGISVKYRKNRTTKVIISGQNLLHRICRNQKTLSYTQKTDQDIIKEIASSAGLQAEIESLTKQHLFFLHRDLTDYELLILLAEKYDCHFWVEDKKFYFKRLKKNAGEDMVLEYNKSLKSLFPSIDTTKIVSEVEVRGWDFAKGEAVVGSARHGDIQSKGGELVENHWGSAKKVFLDYTINDQDSADKLALDILTRNARGYVTGYGSTEGNTDVLVAKILKLEGLGEKFTGKYLVTEARHELKTGEAYITRFNFTSDIASGNASSDSGDSQEENYDEGEQSKEEEDSSQNSDDSQDDGAAASEQDPSFSNLQWKKEEQSTEKSFVEDKVTLSADTVNFKDNMWVRLTIYPKGYEDENQYINRSSVPIKEGKINYEWKVILQEKTSGQDSEGEQTEYVFVLEAVQPKKVKSSNSPAMKVVDWMEVVLLDEASGKPLAHKEFTLKQGDKEIFNGTSDGEGIARIEDVSPGEYNIILKDDQEQSSDT